MWGFVKQPLQNSAGKMQGELQGQLSYSGEGKDSTSQGIEMTGITAKVKYSVSSLFRPSVTALLLL